VLPVSFVSTMSLPKELLDGVEALVRRFGFSKFQEAVTAVSFSPLASSFDDNSYDYETNKHSIEVRCDTEASDALLDLLIGDNFKVKRLEQIVLTVSGTRSSARRVKKIIQAMKFHNDRRLNWEKLYGTEMDPNIGRFKKLIIEPPYSDHVKQILQQPSMAVFRQVETRTMSNELMFALQNCVFKRGLVKSLRFYGCELMPYHTSELQRMLESKCLHKLDLHNVSFDDSICFDHLIEGFESLKTIQHTNSESGLKSLSMSGMKDFHSRQSRLVRSLRGLTTLKYLDMRLSCETSEIPTVLGNEVLLHPKCKIQTLDLVWDKREGDADSNQEEEDAPDEVGARFDEFFSSLEKNTSICQLFFSFADMISFPDSIMNNLFKVALSPRRDLRRIRLGYLIGTKDLSKFVSASESIDISEAYQCRIRRFDFAVNPSSMFAFNVDIGVSNIQCITHILTKRLPFLYDIGLTYRLWINFKQDAKKFIGREELEKWIEKWNQIWLCLERNRVGVALLHPSVAPSVPTSLWPVVLAKTTSKMSHSSTEGWKKEDNPLDGLFSLVRGLFMGGHLTKHHDEAQTSDDGNKQKSTKRARIE
jgi:hypothetical protein